MRGALQELAGGGPQIFEVTDLTIPAGTDLSAGYEIGTFSFASGEHSCVSSTYIEIASPVSYEVLLAAADDLNWNTGQSVIFPTTSVDVIPIGSLAARGHDFDDTILGNRNAVPAPPRFDPSVPPTWPFVMHVGISSPSVDTPEPLHIVHARASFLVI